MKRTRQSDEELRDLYRNYYVRHYHQEDRGRLTRLLPFMDLGPDMVVADMGCGNGLMLELTHARVGQYHGVDFSSEFIEEARRRQAQAGIRNASFHIESIIEFCDRHEGALPYVEGSQHEGPVTQAHPTGLRGEPAASGSRMHRSLPDP